MKRSELFAHLRPVCPRALAALVAIAAVAEGPPALADAAADQRRADQDARQASLNQRARRIEEVSEAYGRFILVRDQMFLGPSGVKTRTVSLYADAATWLTESRRIPELLARTSDLSVPAVRDTLNQLLAEQARGWAALDASAARLEERAREASTAAAQLALFPTSYVPRYETALAFYNGHVARLRESIASGSAAYSAETREAFRDILDATERVTDLALRAGLASSPELHAAVARARGILRAEREIQPRLQGVNELYDQLSLFVVESRVFEAEDTLALLTARALRAERELRALALAPELAEPALATLENMRLQGAEMWASSLGLYPRAQAIQDMFTIEGPQIAATCRDPATRGQMNCELFRVVFAIPIAAIATLDEASLRRLELQVARIKAGPLAAGSSSP